MNNSKSLEKISTNLIDLKGIFVTKDGDIYISGGTTDFRVDKWISKTNTWISVMFVNSACYDIFIDIHDHLYCSIFNQHQIVKTWLSSTTNKTTVVIGTGVRSSASNSLAHPRGIFVDINLNIYIADMYNHRIQFLRFGQLDGKTIVGSGSAPTTIELIYPTDIALDGDQRLYVVEQGNHRIIQLDENHIRCIIGCIGQGSSLDRLSSPTSISFDSYGNVYTVDYSNDRIQKFLLSKESYGT